MPVFDCKPCRLGASSANHPLELVITDSQNIEMFIYLLNRLEHNKHNLLVMAAEHWRDHRVYDILMQRGANVNHVSEYEH